MPRRVVEIAGGYRIVEVEAPVGAERVVRVDIQRDVRTVEVQREGPRGPRGPRSWTQAFSSMGDLDVFVGDVAFPVPFDSTLDIVLGTLDPAAPPAGSDVLVDVNLDGNSIFAAPGDRLTFGAGVTFATAPVAVTATFGQRLTVDVDQIGSTSPGQDLVVVILGTEA